MYVCWMYYRYLSRGLKNQFILPVSLIMIFIGILVQQIHDAICSNVGDCIFWQTANYLLLYSSDHGFAHRHNVLLL